MKQLAKHRTVAAILATLGPSVLLWIIELVKALVPWLDRFVVVPDFALLIAALIVGSAVLVRGLSWAVGAPLILLYLGTQYLLLLYMSALAGSLLQGTYF